MSKSRDASLAGRMHPWGMVALIFGLVLATYWPALRGSLVWDDAAHVTRPDLQGGAGLGRIWSDPRATQQYYPVLNTVFWLEHRLWGDATLGYHLANVAWHAAASCLLALVLRRLWGSAGPRPAAAAGAGGGLPAGTEWLAAAIFAVHPVCVESVAWISEQKNTLSLVLYLVAAAVYLDFDVTRRGRSYACAAILFLLALGTKTVTGTLPAALLVVLWWRDGRLGWRKDIWPLLPWFVAAAVAGLFTAWVERVHVGAAGARFDLDPTERLLLAGRAVWFYLGKLAWPADLMFFYPRWDVPAEAPAWFGYLGGAIGVTAGLWALRKRVRGPLAGWLFFVGSLSPALGFCNVYPFLYSYVADHFQYLASLGFVTTVAAGAGWLLRTAGPGVRRGALVVGATAVVALAFLAHRQSRTYQSSVALYRAVLARNPDSWVAHSNLADELARSPGHESEVLAHCERAVQIRPDYAELHFNLAAHLAAMPGREDEAVTHYREALRRQPGYPAAGNNLANLLARLPGREAEAVPYYEEALRARPADATLHYNLAGVLAKLPGGGSAAIARFEEALRLQPQYADAHYNLANELMKVPGRQTEASAHYEAAVRIRSDFAEAENNLAIALAMQPGRQAEAERYFRKALRAKPDLAEIHCNLAALLAREPGRESEAARHFEKALDLRPNDAKTHNNLAVVYARLGWLDAARRHWHRALEIEPGYEVARLNLGIL